MKEKVCFKCNILKPIEQYYKHKMMADGHLNKCKDCNKKDVRERELVLRNSDANWVENEKERGREKYHRLYSLSQTKKLDGNFNVIRLSKYEKKLHKINSQEKWKKNNPISSSLVNKKYQEKYPEKYKCKLLSQRLKCGKGNNLHHWSYNVIHAIDVIELTREDHVLLHRHITYDQSVMMYRNKEGVLLDSRESHIKLLKKLKK